MSDGYTITSARQSSDPAAVIVQTAESGAVVVSQRDRPELWAQLMASGVDIEPYCPRTVLRSENPGHQVGPDTVSLACDIIAGALPGLKATPFRRGNLKGTIYDFQQAGAELPSHSHGDAAVHISVVARGRVASRGVGWERDFVAGDVIAFLPDQQHNLVGLEAGSRVVNIVYGR